jgi:hypothetical protein
MGDSYISDFRLGISDWRRTMRKTEKAEMGNSCISDFRLGISDWRRTMRKTEDGEGGMG